VLLTYWPLIPVLCVVIGIYPTAKTEFTTGHFLPNARILDAATCRGGLAAKTNSANRVFANLKRQQVGASVKVSGTEKPKRKC